jgi:propionate catabolism operon transcriptional regulator
MVAVGASRVIRTDVRVIATTKRDLSRMAEHGQFRADLWYRLNVIAIALPPLRERVASKIERGWNELINSFHPLLC